MCSTLSDESGDVQDGPQEPAEETATDTSTEAEETFALNDPPVDDMSAGDPMSADNDLDGLDMEPRGTSSSGQGEAPGQQFGMRDMLPDRTEADLSRTIIEDANHIQKQSEWSDDLSPRQREEEDLELIGEWIQSRVQHNKWTHFANQAQEGRFIAPGNINPAQPDKMGFQVKPLQFTDSRDGLTVEESQRENFKKLHGYYPIHDEFTEFVPETYYHPNKPLPIFRNHEALTTMDARDPRYIPPGKSQEEDPADLFKISLKRSKLDQMNTGVAYSPDFDFELWSEDYNRPRKPKDWPDEFRNKKQAQEYYSLKFGGTLPGPKVPIERIFRPLPPAEAGLKDEFVRADRHSKLIKFTWRGRMTRNIYQTSQKPTFHGVVIVGNGAGCAGLGFGRAKSYREALKKAEEQAVHNMVYLPRYRDGQLSHLLVGKHNSCKVVINPMPVGRGEVAPAVIRAVCMAFGVRDYSGYFKVRRKNKFTQIRAVWDCFLQATNPSQAAEDRGVRLVEAVPEVDGASYHLPVGFAHNNRQNAIKILQKHLEEYNEKEQLDKYKLTDEQKQGIPAWLSDTRDIFWERYYGGEPDLFLNEAGVPCFSTLNEETGEHEPDHDLEMQALQMIEPGVDPAGALSRPRTLRRSDT